MAQIRKAKDNILTGKDLDIAYKRYQAEYEDTRRRQKARGLSMYIEKMNKMEFQYIYEATANQIELDTGKTTYASERAKMNKVIDTIVDNQRYAISHDQARAYQKAVFEKENIKLSLDEIYKTLPASLEETNNRLKAEGISGSERAKIISNVFFGSN